MTKLLHEYASRQADARPDAVAVTDAEGGLSYQELERSSNQLARGLREVGCRPGDRVCLFTGKTRAAITAMLAVLKAGCAYVPIDIEGPSRRTATIVGAAEPQAILVGARAAGLLEASLHEACFDQPFAVVGLTGDLDENQISRLTLSRADWERESAEPLPIRGSGDDPAHILFTSGSTGIPKGVVIKHSNVIPFVEWAISYFGISPSDRMSGHPPLHFDLSTFDVYAAQAAGAQLHLVPPAFNLLPHKLAQFIRDAELTQWFSVPSTMTYMASLDTFGPDDFPSLKRVLWCGEVLPTPTLIHWMRRLPHAQFTNLYGPTEATIASSYHTVERCPRDPTTAIPIGRPCPGEELLVLDSELRPVPVGETGDLYIAGCGLSPGYWRDEPTTHAAFIADPRGPASAGRIYRTGDLARIDKDGLVHFLGRADTQIKSRGYRIELGEIESALHAIDELRESAVVAVAAESFEGWAICCAYSAAAASLIEPKQLREALRQSLPSYMLPSRWLSLPELPKNANGKIDRPRLRELFGSEPAPSSPPLPVEASHERTS
ncbi:MAG: amino acid adenylation domain-containing protein [Gaiellaceae bacterium]